jgi:prepilin-type N-terminal cleavage/methylation domain-containing protein
MIRTLLSLLSPEEDGYTLVEMVVVMAILGVVMAGLTTIFVGGSNAQVALNGRFKAQQETRTAVDRIRSDIHCASKAQAQAINTYPALRLNVTSCNASTTYDYWCVISSQTSPQRYQVFRTTSSVTPSASTCTSTDTSRILIANNLVSAAAFTTNATPQNGLQTVSIDFKASGDATSNTKSVYELTDSIVVRNGTRCSSSSANWVAGTSTCTVVSVP